MQVQGEMGDNTDCVNLTFMTVCKHDLTERFEVYLAVTIEVPSAAV